MAYAQQGGGSRGNDHETLIHQVISHVMRDVLRVTCDV